MKTPTPAFTSIDTANLDAVTGGASSRSSSRATTDERLMDKLQSIQTAIKDVASQQTNKGGDAMSQMMPILAMSMMKKR
jgi:hypothetical protein